MPTSACGLWSFGKFWKSVRTFVVVMVVLLPVSGGTALAQDPLSPEQLRIRLDEAERLLRDAQDRKNQLSTDNARLKGEVDRLTQQIKDMEGRMEEMKRTDAEHADESFYLRSHYKAWQAFIRDQPDLRARWRVFLGNDFLLTPKKLPEGVNSKWPTSTDEE